MKGVDPEGSAESRWAVWQIAMGEIRKRPVTGLGLGMMPIANRFEALRAKSAFTVRGVRDTHSTYLRLAAETGIPGLVIYLLMWAAVLRKIRRVRGQIRYVRHGEHQLLMFIEVAIISWMVASIFGTYPYIAFTYIGLSVAWLTAEIMEREPWYVPAKAAIGMIQPAARRAR
jgi:O-antigen ligase